MKAVEFKDQNKVLGEGDENVLDLPAFIGTVTNGVLPVVTCWEFKDIKERKKFLRTGKIFIVQMTDGNGLNPLSISPINPIIKKKLTKAERDQAKKDAKEMMKNREQ